MGVEHRMSAYVKTNWVDNETPLGPVALNKIEVGIEKASSLSKYPTASGTATAIIVSALHFALENGETVTFIASLNNSRGATTLNVNSLGAKSVLLPGESTNPKLIAGRAYTVWYSTANACFYLKNAADNEFVPYGFYDTLSTYNVDLTNNNADIVLYKDFAGSFQFTISALPGDKERIISIHWTNADTLHISNGTSRTISGDVWNTFSNLSANTYIIIRLTPVGSITVASVKKF